MGLLRTPLFWNPPIILKPTTDKDNGDTTSKSVDEKGIATNQNNVKVVSWILNSIGSSIVLSLQAFTKASYMWNHMKKLYR